MTKQMAYVYNIESLGKDLKEISKDYIRTQSQNVTSRWFHAKNVDVFVWQDEKDNIIKQQISFYGLITEWNVVDGVRTGLIVEEEHNDKLGIPGSEIIKFDKKVNYHSLEQSISLIKNTDTFLNHEKAIILSNYTNNPSLSKMPSKEIFKNYAYLKKPKFSLMHWLKSVFS